MEDIFLVAIGAILGSNTRFVIYKQLEKLNISKNFSIIIINSFASFFLGLFLSVMSRIRLYEFSHQLVLFFSIGFLGSLSTFSTFIYDCFEVILKFKFVRAFKLFLISLGLGIFSLAFGFLLGSQ